MNSSPWLSIVGIGEDGLAGVPAAGRALIDGAEIVLGGQRHLEMLPGDHPAEQWTWKSPLKDTVRDLHDVAGRPVCVLATGDPMSYGIGVTLGREFGHQALTVLPAVGAFSLAAARTGWPLQDVDCLTLHGRPLDLIAPYLRPGARLLVLSEDGATPAQVARYLEDRGFGDSQLSVLCHLGGPKEERVDGLARDWGGRQTADLNTIAVTCVAGAGASWYGRTGLPDAAFLNDGQLTKREVRAVTLASLAPQPGELLWDVGGGCGSISIEWMRAGGRAIAIENHAERADLIARNAARLGVPQLKVVRGDAPAALDGLPAPQAVFIGGGITADLLAETCWQALAAPGRLVANTVTLSGEEKLHRLWHEWGGEMSRIDVSRLLPVGGQHGWKPFRPVTHYQVWKKDG